MENQIYKDFCVNLVSKECYSNVFYYTCINMSHIIRCGLIMDLFCHLSTEKNDCTLQKCNISLCSFETCIAVDITDYNYLFDLYKRL